MIGARVFFFALGVVALGAAQEGELVALERGAGCGPGRKCPTCHKLPPKGFNFAPCPVEARFSGTFPLTGDCNTGHISLSIGGDLRNACGSSEPCRRASFNVKHFKIEQLHFEKHGTTVDVKHPHTSPGCACCDVILTYPIGPGPGPPPKPPQCKVPLDFVSVVDVSKSMGTHKGTKDGTIDMLQRTAARFEISKKVAHFALTTFGDVAYKNWGLRSGMSNSQHAVAKGIGAIYWTTDFSNHGAGLDSAVTQLEDDSRHKIPRLLVLFADGKPNKDLVRLHKALARLRCMPGLCFAIVGINIKDGSEEDWFFRSLLGCTDHGKCKQLFLVKPGVKGEPERLAKALSKHLCDCAKAAPPVPWEDSVTTFTVRIAGVTLPDFGTRDELNYTVDEMLYNAAEATGVTPDRLTAIAIEDTAGNIIQEDLIAHSQRSLGQADSTAPATLVEVMFREPGLNAEVGAQEGARQLSAIMSQPESTFKDRCAARGLSGLKVERIALRQNDGLMPIIDVVQE